MANLPRYALIDDGSTFHITWQCHNKSFLLKTNWAKKLYYNLLLKYKDRYQIKIYSYCFMGNHPHFTGYCEKKDLLSDFMRVVNACFAKGYNKQTNRKGQVVMDRFKSPRIQTDADLFKVMHYIDLNPKRAHMVKHPREYQWSSYHYYAYGKTDPLITPAPSYVSLASSAEERQSIYQEMVEKILENDWKEKQPYSSTPFIGNPDWVLRQTKQLKSLKTELNEKAKIRYQNKFSMQNCLSP